MVRLRKKSYNALRRSLKQGKTTCRHRFQQFCESRGLRRESAVPEVGPCPQPLASRVVVQEPLSPISVQHVCRSLYAVFRRLGAGVRPSVLLMMFLAFGVGIGVSNWLKRHPLKHIVFESDFVHITPEELTPRLSGLLNDSLFELDLAQIQSQLLSLPWVERVSLRRLWPDGLHISISEKKVRAKWGDEGFISDAGVIFAAPLTPAAAAFSAYLPELMGSKDDVRTLLDYYEKMSVVLAPTGLEVVKLTRGSRQWRITLTNNINIIVNPEGVLEKLVRFRQVYEQLGERQMQIASADLRYHHGVAITWRGENAPPDNS